MSITDPIADMLTRIRNANLNRWESLDIPSSKMKVAILKILKEEGFIKDYKEVPIADYKNIVRVYLKFGPLKQQVISRLERVSKTSRRVYKKAKEIDKIFGGIGIAIYSTPGGVKSDRECRKLKIGGELLCIVY
ncbi:MAG: 30S ribosomal protein S8 [Candidatus Loosdrechtia sp.]|uniref:uS8 family ribosomal protein n=1 Tax=Candidatus Loosdrechtia sp. TaxID=3101272 RepID=UPI003A6241BA|nr:MAG: 30S ribosomal protein S8 [Candidatus Jettenia sp. AMX2]